MKPYIVSLYCIWTFTAVASAEDPRVCGRTLDNGIRAVYLHVPGSEQFTVCSFLPMGLASDDANHAQWSHLVEHLTVRTTVPDTSQDGNAETLADHTRLDYYGTRDNWRTAVSHHKRWLGGEPFDARTLKVEAPRANSEADTTADSLFSGKFAIAAWDQGYRHGLKHAAVKQDLLAAGLGEVQRYRDAHLFVPRRTVVCAIGGVEPDAVLDALSESLGGLKSAADPPGRLEGLKPIDATITWDLSSRHLMYTWPGPGPERPGDYAAVRVISAFLTARAARDAQLRQLCGPVWCAADLVSPEGPQFFISATLKPGADPQAVRAKFDEYMKSLADSQELEQGAPTIGAQLAGTLKPSLLGVLAAQVTEPAQQKLAEAQFALMWGTAEFQLGNQRDAVVRALENVTQDDIRRVVARYLGVSPRTALLLVPKALK